MTSFRIPGASDSPSGTAAARRAWLQAAPEAEVADWLRSSLPGWRDAAREHAAAVAKLVGAPVGEVVASPFGFRACAMAASVGAAIVHHELRPSWRWDPDLLADDVVADESTGRWVDGALVAGRYEGFCQDLPFGGFDPNHSARWTPHELLHRVCGFAWWPGMSRWSLYHAARLGEIAPVAHWYGTDLALRLDRDGFDRTSDAEFPSAPLEKADWLTEGGIDERFAAAVIGLRVAARWLDAELAAVAREKIAHETVAVADPLLDSVTDAIAYCTGHHARLTHPTVAAVLANATVAGVHRFADLGSYQAHIESVFDQLVFGAISVDPEASSAALAGRMCWDLSLRAALCDPVVADEVLAPHLESLQTAATAAHNGDGTAATELLATLGAQLRDAGLDELFPIGLNDDLEPFPSDDRPQIEAGVWTVAPGLPQALAESGSDLGTWLADLPDDVLWSRAPLVSRLVSATEALDSPDNVREQAVLAFAIAAATARDDLTERLAIPPEQWPNDVAGMSAIVRANPVFKPTEAPANYLVGRFGEAVSVLPYPTFIAALWDLLTNGPRPANVCLDVLENALNTATRRDDFDEEWPTDAATWLRELANAGAIALLIS